MLGYCLGGTIAFELVKKLEAMGDEVLFVGGIDNPPDLKRIMGRLQYRTLMIDLLPALTSLTREEADDFGLETAHVSLFSLPNAEQTPSNDRRNQTRNSIMSCIPCSPLSSSRQWTSHPLDLQLLRVWKIP